MRITKYFGTLLILVIVSPVWGEDSVYFVDANLKILVESQLGIDNPSPADMLGLTSLQAQQAGISDLTGIEYAMNLVELHLWENQISDLSPLSGLTNLTTLYLWSNRISDVSPLSELTHLTVLALPDNRIADVSALAGLANLTKLYLYDNQIADVSSLSGLINLEELYLYGNQITDISPLAGLTHLTTLELGANQIQDVWPLAGLTNLTGLYLWDNQITDVSGLAGLTGLQELYLQTNQISDVSPLSGLTDLQKLHVWENRVSDISALSGMTRLTELALPNNQIQDISPLSGLINLQTLYLYVNQISDISPLSALTGLTTLDVEDNQVSDVSALSGLVNLTSLELGDNQISEISSLSLLTSLQALHLHNNQISDTSSLAEMLNLTQLDLADNLLNDISPLSNLVNLTDLALNGNQITDISALAGLTDWETLSLQENPLSPRAYCTDLYVLVSHDRTADYDPNPIPPDHVTASPGLLARQVQIAWDPVCNGPNYTSYYQIYRGPSPTGTKTAISAWQTETEFLDDTAAPGVTYTYWVRAAVNDRGSEGLTDYSATTQGAATYVDLRDGGASYRGFTPQLLGPGQEIEIHARIENGGTASSGPFKLDVYLSLDAQVDVSDYHLGQMDVAALAPGGVFDFKGAGTLSESIPTGEYTVGWIIDQDNQVIESDETNNEAHIEGYRLTVASLSAPTPDPMTWAITPHATGQTSIAMTATTALDAGGGVEYLFDCQTPGGHDSNWQASPTYEDVNLSPDTVYQYRVMARDGLDNHTDFSASASARTDEAVLGQVQNENTGLWYDTIQPAIDAADVGHSIKVYPGTYTGPIDFQGKVITLRSGDPSNRSVVENTILDGQGAAGFITLNSNGILDGLTITGCSDPDSWQGAIRCTAQAPTIRRCIIRDNHSRASAGICTQGFASATVEDCRFIDNSALGNGGALGGDFVVIRCAFSGNHADMSGGAISACISVSRSTFSHNTAGVNGGALYSSASGLTITDCIFSDNAAQAGGGVFANAPVMTNCLVQNNTAEDSGGGLFITQSPRLIGCAILGNTAQAGNGGGVYHSLNQLSLVNCTIRNCLAPSGQGGGLYSEHGLQMKNTILWDNRAGEFNQLGGTGAHFYEHTHLQSCAIENGSMMPHYIGDGQGHVIGLNQGGNFVFSDPQFMDTWHLRQNSPCRNQGQADSSLPKTDPDGDPRVVDTAVDIGADEVTTDTALPVPNPLGWWELAPQAQDSHTIVMIVAQATGTPEPVEYLFECQQDAGLNSPWQTDRRYEVGGLTPATAYQFRVKARNGLGNETAFSDWRSATTHAAIDTDVTAPTPNPLTWASKPQATGMTAVTMTATTALDASGVEYLFQCVAGGGHDSDWQASPVYVDTDLQAGVPYTYRVRARDLSTQRNTGEWSVSASVITQSAAGLDSVDVRVTATQDDVEELPSGRMDFTSPNLELIHSEADQIIGVRFKHVKIPARARIANAYIEFHVAGLDAGPCLLTIRGQRADRAPTFAAFAGLSSLATTSTSVTWNPSPWTALSAVQRSANLQGIVQEIVNRPGWSQGNDLVFIITGSGRRVAQSYDGGGYLNGPLLHIDFE